MIGSSNARQYCSTIRPTAIWTSVAPKSTLARSATDHGNSTASSSGSSQKSRVGADHAAERLPLGVHGSVTGRVVAARVVEDHGPPDRDRSDPDLRDPRRSFGSLYLHRRH